MPRISGELLLSDHLGAWKVRWGFGRNQYIVPPGLYALGSPGPESPVVVTANYKMSYDLVRSHLKDTDVWLLILETFGINVWCAAGKGSFGTDELVQRIKAAGLKELLQHRELLLPVLGAPGVAAHEVSKETGFTVRYAAIHASDLPEYLSNGRQTTPAMKKLTFSFRDRLVLIPVELVQTGTIALPALALILLLGWLFGGVASAAAVALVVLMAIGLGVIVVPLLLPWIPGASFACKGAMAGLLGSALLIPWLGNGFSVPAQTGAALLLTALSAYLALNFTGCTPFTSPSGVRKEMRIAGPLILSGLAIAIGSWGWALFS